MERLVLQRLEKPENSTSVARPIRPHDLRHVRILLIDDDPQAQALIEMALVDAQFERQDRGGHDGGRRPRAHQDPTSTTST